MTSPVVLSLEDASRQGVVGLWGIGTATPSSVLQKDAIGLAEELACGTDRERAWLRRVFSRTGVDARGSVLVKGIGDPVEELRAFYRARIGEEDHGPTTAERMACYAREAPALAERAARESLGNARVSAEAVTHLITVSCTGFSAPGLDVELIRRLGLSGGVKRLHVGFMGCHAAFNALGAARAIVLADPAAVVLVCCVELCSLHFAYGWSPEKLVANALFADGAAAAIVGEAGGEEHSWQLRETASLLLPETLEAMTWRIGDHGFAMTLSPELPGLVRGNLRGWCEEWLGRSGVGLGDVKSWAVHPGGPKVLTAVEEALGLGPEALRFSRGVLAEHGNMSSTTVLFVLQRMAREGAESPCVALGFGPGLMMEGMLLERQ